MARIKPHLLDEIADTIIERGRTNETILWRFLERIEQFALTGQDQFRIFLQIFENEVVITTNPWSFYVIIAGVNFDRSPFFTKPILTWARKLTVGTLMGHAENRKSSSEGHWTKLVEMFPNFETMFLRDYHFFDLVQSPAEFQQLKKIEFDYFSSYARVFEALVEHSNKFPKLDSIECRAHNLNEIPNSGITLPAIKHLKVVMDRKDYLPTDFPWTAAYKLFPSLTSLHVNFKSYDIAEHLIIDDYEWILQEFHSLAFDFSIKVTFNQCLDSSWQESVDTRLQYFSTQGEVSTTSSGYKVNIAVPGKLLVFKLHIDDWSDPDFDSFLLAL